MARSISRSRNAREISPSNSRAIDSTRVRAEARSRALSASLSSPAQRYWSEANVVSSTTVAASAAGRTGNGLRARHMRRE